MAFRSANLGAHMIKFNSAASSELLELYNNILDTEIQNENAEPKHRTFAPSAMRCDRISWFRLRGTQPDKIASPDKGLAFAAQIGTACHEAIQERLSTYLKDDWISVEDYVSSNPERFADYDWSFTHKGFETLIDMKAPYPVRFACDGIFRFNDTIRLLEIKTAEFASLNDLTGPKEKHLDQVKCYATLLQIPDVIFLYQDRQYGELKCFEINVNMIEQRTLRERMSNVMHLAEVNIAPEGLPKGDPDCTSNMCPYYKVCREWGR